MNDKSCCRNCGRGETDFANISKDGFCEKCEAAVTRKMRQIARGSGQSFAKRLRRSFARQNLNVIILMIAIFFASSCFGQSSLYTIKEGAHYFQPMPVKVVCSLRSLSRTVIFGSSCKYHFDDADDSDINKLFGWSSDLLGGTSIRVGWNCKSSYLTGVDLYAYFHINGKRWIPTKDESSNKSSPSLIVKNIRYGEEVFVSVINTDTSVVFIATHSAKTDTLIIYKRFPVGCGYIMHPYFGGNKTAPHPMQIMFK